MREHYIGRLIQEINKRPCLWDPKNSHFNNPVQTERHWKIIQLEVQALYNHEDVSVADLKLTYENITKAVKFGFSIGNPYIFKYTDDIKWYKREDYEKTANPSADGAPPRFLSRNVMFQYAFNIMVFLLFYSLTTNGKLVASGHVLNAVIFVMWGLYQFAIYMLSTCVLREVNVNKERSRNDMECLLCTSVIATSVIPAAIWLQWYFQYSPKEQVITCSWGTLIVIFMLVFVACCTRMHSMKRTRPPLRNPLIAVFINDMISVVLLSYYCFFVFGNLYYLLFPLWILGNSLIHNYSNYLLWKTCWIHFPKFTEKPFCTVTVNSFYACDFVID